LPGAARVGPEVNGAGLLLWWSVPRQGSVVEVCCAPSPPGARLLSRIGFCRWWWRAAAGRDAAAGVRCCRPDGRRAATGLIRAGATHVSGGFGVGRYRCSSSAGGFGPVVGFGPACRFGLLAFGLGPACRFGLLAFGLGRACRCGVSSGFCPGCGLGARGGCLAGRYRATAPLSVV